MNGGYSAPLTTTIRLIGEHEATVEVRGLGELSPLGCGVTLTVADPRLLSHSGLTPQQARQLGEALIRGAAQFET